jgi:hypothetical protein
MLDLLGLEPLPDADGQSLVTLWQDGGGRASRAVPSALLRYVWAPDAPQQFALVSESGRKVLRRGESPAVVYDLHEDSSERRDLPSSPEQRLALDTFLSTQREEAARFAARYGAPDRGVLDAGEGERLRALGYLE